MESISAAGTSVDRRPAAGAAPPCVKVRAAELLDLAVLKILAFSLGGTAGIQILALWVALLAPPHLHYLPEIGR